MNDLTLDTVKDIDDLLQARRRASSVRSQTHPVGPMRWLSEGPRRVPVTTGAAGLFCVFICYTERRFYRGN